jgi:hypothetical protein
MLEDNHISNSDENTEDPFHMLLDEDLTAEEEGSAGALASVLAASGVVHQHANRAVIGPSRVEQHISACAAKDVEQTSGRAAGLPAALCDILQPTQVPVSISQCCGSRFVRFITFCQFRNWTSTFKSS